MQTLKPENWYLAKDFNKDCPSETVNFVFDQLSVHKLLLQMC